jgi:hypothetical protein
LTRLERARLRAKGSRPVYLLGRCDWCGNISRGLWSLKRELADRGLGTAAVLAQGDVTCASCTAAAIAACRVAERAPV